MRHARVVGPIVVATLLACATPSSAPRIVAPAPPSTSSAPRVPASTSPIAASASSEPQETYPEIPSERCARDDADACGRLGYTSCATYASAADAQADGCSDLVRAEQGRVRACCHFRAERLRCEQGCVEPCRVDEEPRDCRWTCVQICMGEE
jgi:hypothetical protein